MKTKTIFTAFLIFIQISIYSQGTWTQTNLSLARIQMEAAINGSNIYFAGGRTDSYWASCTPKVDIYNVVTDTWSTANLSLARSHPAAASLGNKVLFAGGLNPNPTARVDIFDTGTQNWSTANLSKARFSIGTAVYGSKILFAGGGDMVNNKVFNTIDIFDVVINAWTTDTLSVARGGMGTAVVGSKAYFGGGYMMNNKCSDRIDIYDFTTGSWEKATLPLARCLLAATAVGKKILFAGGMTEQNLPTDRVDIYDTETKAWTVSKLSKPRAFVSNAASMNGKAYFAGGLLLDFTTYNIYGFFDIVDIYDPTTGMWSTENLSHSLNSNVVISFGNKLYSAGGFTANGYIKTVDIYNAGFGNWTKTELSQYKEHMASAVLGDKVYFAGGYAIKPDFSGQFSTDKVEIYDTKTGKWTYDKLSKGRDWLEGANAGSKVIFAGGWDDVGNIQKTVDIYDTLTKKWTVANLSTARFEITTGKIGNLVMFAGGYDNNWITSTRIDIYNAETGVWTTNELSVPRWGAASASVGDLIMFAGGMSLDGAAGTEVITDVIDIYNAKTKQWSTAKLSIPRVFAAGVTVQDKVLFAGGQDIFGEPYKRVYIYNVTTNDWSIDSLSVARAFHDNDQNAATVCGKAFFVGGVNRLPGTYIEDYNTIDIYDPETNTWETDELPYNLFGHSVVGVGNKLIVAGGMSILPQGFDIHKEVLIFDCFTSKTDEPGIHHYDLSVFPNPTSDHFSLDLPEDFNYENAVMTVYDLYGRRVMQKKGIEIIRNHNMSGQPEGIYFINLQSSIGKAVSRLIKM
ncbi:MAG: T9SS type A sorting domain-containing protein [Saprospiraceae bacterium]|nr:T9SS type A sorting domain-containing protein [Saprospiraceae bacterium]